MSDSIDTTQSSCDKQKKNRESWGKQHFGKFMKKNFINLFNIDLFDAKHYLREIVRKLKILMLGKFCLHRNKNKSLHHREIPHKETFNQTIYVLFSHEDNLVR